MKYKKLNLKFKKNKAITLLELMITIAIIAIISGVAIPSVQQYTIKAQVQESIALADGAKPAVLEYYTNYGEFPADNEDAGYDGASGSYVSSVEVDAGTIISSFGNQANTALIGATITLIPIENVNGTISWTCSSTAQEKFLPSSCKT